MGEDRRGESEADDIGKGIQFASELARGVGQAGDAAVKPVGCSRQTDRFGGNPEICLRQKRIVGEVQCAMNRADNREVSEEDIGGGE